MGYYGYRSWRSRHWGENPPSKFTLLVNLFGDAVIEIKNAFLNLDKNALEELLADYGVIHGEAAANYARKAFSSWKSGTTKLSGKTMEKLIELVPPYLSSELRLKILKFVINQNKQTGPTLTIDINIEEPYAGFSQLDKEIKKMNVADQLAYLPEKVMKAATWLYDNDITAARAMLAEATKVENEIIKINAIKEIDLLKRTIKSKQIKSASYTVEMPAGKIYINAFTPSLISKIFRVFK